MKRGYGTRSVTRTWRRPNSQYRLLYMCARWRLLRRMVLARDKNLCQDCLARGLTTSGNQVDHILRAEDRPELFYKMDNLQTLCRKCHGEKTQKGE